MLTGGTGLTDSYLLHDLTRSGHWVARDRQVSPAAERVAEVVGEPYEVTRVVAGNPRHSGTATVRLYSHWNMVTYRWR